MKTDEQLKKDVAAELAWDPAINTTNIGVAVRSGIVTLSGTLDTYVQKHAVERAVRRVAGVRGIALDLEVRLAPGHARTDSEIAQAAAHALRWHSLVPEDKVKVEVEDGWIRLSGETDWAYQRASAEQSVRPLVGVRGVTNDISIKARANASEISRDISSALERHARREAQRIAVDVEGGVVTLRGTVESLADRQAVVGTAYAARGVSRVVDQLEVAA
jgi:osmotically-inducible protein OsmY